MVSVAWVTLPRLRRMRLKKMKTMGLSRFMLFHHEGCGGNPVVIGFVGFDLLVVAVGDGAEVVGAGG